MAIHYCMLELVLFKVLSHTDTVAEDASESALVRYPGANEIGTGSPQKHVHVHVYYACHEVMTSGF